MEKEGHTNGGECFHHYANLALTTASLKWRLGAWSIQGLPLLTASPLIEIMRPWLAQQRNPAMSPNTKGKEQAAVTLDNTTVEKKKSSSITTKKA